ncbi:MAG: cation diffusion facilitator family transporter [Candidatus Zixiibacteriota bacterium]
MSDHHHHSHVHDHQYSGSTGKLFLTILLNVIITAAEFIGGLISGYLALIADAFHNLSDVAALILAYFGEISSKKPATKRSTFGYKRIEVMTAFISAVSLVVIAIYIFYEAYLRILEPIELTNPTLILIIASIGLVGNILSVFLLHSSKDKTLNIKAAFLHMLYDALSSAAVIIGAIIIIKTDLMLIDPILSIIIGLMIIGSSYGVLKEATLIFLESVPKNIDFDEVADTIKEHPKVQDIHHLHIWSLSSSAVALSAHICLKEEDFKYGPEVIAELGQIVSKKFNIGHATFQPEMGICADEGRNWVC